MATKKGRPTGCTGYCIYSWDGKSWSEGDDAKCSEACTGCPEKPTVAGPSSGPAFAYKPCLGARNRNLIIVAEPGTRISFDWRGFVTLTFGRKPSSKTRKQPG